MERFIFQVIEPLISKELEQDRHRQRIEKITEELKAFVSGELVPVNKKLAKKTRELFVASSDVEKLKEAVDHLQKESNKLRQELASRESDIFKQKMSFEREIQALQEQLDSLKKQLKRTIKKGELDIEHLQEKHRDRIFDLKKQHRLQLQAKLNEQKSMWQGEVASLKETHAQEKSHILQENSKERAKIIKKYEEKIYNIKSEGEEMIEKNTKDYNEKIDALRKTKGELEKRLTSSQEECRRLSLELERQISQHRAFKMQFQSTFGELQGSRKRNQEERQRLIDDYDALKAKSRQTEKSLNQRIKSLQLTLKETIQAKDKLFVDTVETMTTEHRIEVQSLHNTMLEERQMAITNIEVKAYEQMFEQNKKYQRLEVAHRDLQERYNSIKDIYETRIRQAESSHAQEMSAINQRKAYEFQLSGQNAKREYINLQNKFTLQIRSLKAQHQSQQQAILKKAQEEKVSLSNKLVSQYEAMLSDQRSNTEIQIKQKLLQFERKAKAYEKRVAEGEKRKSELKVTIQRMKLESQMKIESMMEANEKLEEEIESLHERILELEKMKSTLINDYEFQILLLKNQMEKLRDQYHQREDELRANLNEKIVVKNKEIARFAERIKQETEQLLRKHKDRVTAIEKEYEQLKRVITQKTSLPEDIQALKVFHAAYIAKENELLSQRRRRQDLQRELHSKDAIQKVFTSKQAFKKLTIVDKFAATAKLSLLRQS